MQKKLQSRWECNIRLLNIVQQKWKGLSVGRFLLFIPSLYSGIMQLISICGVIRSVLYS